VEQLEQRCCPSYTLVTSRTALAGTDSLNWGTLGTPPVLVANPFTILSASGQSITVSKPLSGDFQTAQQHTPATGTGMVKGNFAPGDILLSSNNAGGKPNPIRLNFGATPVAAGGTQIDAGLYGSFTAQIQALDARGRILASFTEAGSTTNAADNSAIFIGISSSSASISQIAISLTNAPDNSYKAYFLINQFDFRTSAPAAAPAVLQSAPAPGLAPPLPSSPATGQPAVPAAPVPGSAGASTPPASLGAVLAGGTSSSAPAGPTDAVSAASRAATNDDSSGLFAPLSWTGWEAV
jgi:hypothetical protein